MSISYDDKAGTLTIGAREGSYKGMASTRTIRVRWFTPGKARVLNLDGSVDATLNYSGKPLTVSAPK